MVDSYNQIAHQILSKKNHDLFHKHFNEFEVDNQKYLEKDFLIALELLKKSYPATFKLFGETNFKKLTYMFCKYYPYNHSDLKKYGKKLPDFLAALPSLNEYVFLKWIAKVDWFWTQHDEVDMIAPLGTHISWKSVMRNDKDIEIDIDEHHLEKLTLQKNGNEYLIKEI